MGAWHEANPTRYWRVSELLCCRIGEGGDRIRLKQFDSVLGNASFAEFPLGWVSLDEPFG